jgi:hypothetical protein
MNSKPIVGLAAIALVVIALCGWMFAARTGNKATEPAVIAEWSAYIPAVVCNFLNSDGTNTTLEGSGMLVRGASGDMGIVASADVLSRDGRIANACHGDFQDGTSYTMLPEDIHVDPQLTVDAGFIHLNGDAASRAAALTQKKSMCAGEPIIGSHIVVLGYPHPGCGAALVTCHNRHPSHALLETTAI